MSPSATPDTQSAAASPATNPVQARHRSQPSAISATPATQNEGIRRKVPRLPPKTIAYLAKCHACHAKCHGVTGDQSGPSAPPEPARCHKCHTCLAKRKYTSPSALPATQNEGICRQVPRLPRKVPRRHRRHPATNPVQARHRSQPNAISHKCHACHAKRRYTSPSATPVTQNEGICRQVPRLPRKVPRRHRQPIRSKRATGASPMQRKTKVYVPKCHACHAKRRDMSPSATPDLQSAAASPATNPVQARHQSQPKCHKCHACHTKRRYTSPSATPAMQNEGICRQVPRLPRKVPRRHRRPIRSKRATGASLMP